MQLDGLFAYFLFPFALDREAIQQDHPEAWTGKTKWLDGLDAWMADKRHQGQQLRRLGTWKRATYSEFHAGSQAYSDLLFFNSIVRHVFFDTNIGRHPDEQENQLRCFSIEIPSPQRLWFAGSDAIGGSGRAEINDLRLYISAHGTGILSIGVETGAIDPQQALWLMRRLRKLYPLDGTGVRDGRTPNRLALLLEVDGQIETLCEERFEDPKMVGFYPPLASVIRSLLYFADYNHQEYEPVLDENMMVYSYGELNMHTCRDTLDNGGLDVVEEFLFLRHLHGDAACYESSHSSMLIGFTGHSCTLLHVKSCEATDQSRLRVVCGSQRVVKREDLDVCKMFHTNFYLMAVVAIFYRAILMDFSERSALVARHLLRDQQAGTLSLASIQLVNEFRAQFLNFSGYWHFDDLSCKQADNDFFRRLCREYRVDDMKEVIGSELRHMTEFVYNFYQLRNTEAVNRLAMLSLVFGGGAVLTGFFGMNFGREFANILFEGQGMGSMLHYSLIAFISTFVFGSLALGTYVVLRSWRDYLALLTPLKKTPTTSSLKRESPE